MTDPHDDLRWMQRALALARQGEGRVEPNPMVGCVITQANRVVGEGFHTAFGADHAEIEALRQAGEQAAGGCLYVNLEPCCHQGKTGPCAQAIIEAQIGRVVVALKDPFPQVAGKGLSVLESHGIEIVTGIARAEAEELNAPYLHAIETGRPWVIAKWAMTLDGKIATSTGESQWISTATSRAKVHQLRGRVDGIVIGRQTAQQDDPLLTARPPGPRTATRIVLDSNAQIACDSQLVRSAKEVPLLVVTGEHAPEEATSRLADAGCEILKIDQQSPNEQLRCLLEILGKRKMTNLLVEGGGTVLGSLLDASLIDEVHAFIAPLIVGGTGPGPVMGNGIKQLDMARRLPQLKVEQIDGDLYLWGRFAR